MEGLAVRVVASYNLNGYDSGVTVHLGQMK
jgi:hypothetical protein